MFTLLKLRLKREIEELKSLHRIEMAELEAKSARDLADKEATFERKQKDANKEHELKTKEVVTLLRLEAEQKNKQVELNYQRQTDVLKIELDQKLNQKTSDLLKESYDKLAAAMTKLHEEGNVTTKFTQDLALKMMGGMPEHKTTTKVITGKSEA
jgi:hypothetical protein